MPKPKKNRWFRRILRAACLVALIWVIVTVSLVLVFRFVDPPASSFMVQRYVHAKVTGESDFSLRHEWRSLDSISPWLQVAVVASEDQKFPQHYGFDIETLRQVASEHLSGEGGRGGSTISQQTAKNLFLWPGRSWLRKGLEAYFTVLIETAWPKRRILEVYLNVAQFGEGIYGAEAAATVYFRKPAADLSLGESARLAAVLPAPTRYRVVPPSSQVQARSAWIERQVGALGGPAYLADLE